MDVFFSGCSNDMVMVGHKDHVMDENLIFFSTFRKCFKDNAGDLFLIEPEGSVIGSTDQMIWVFGLYDPWFPCHASEEAGIMPKVL